MHRVRAWVAGAIVVAVALLIVQNVATVEVQWLWWSVRLRRFVLILLLLAAGFALGWLARGLTQRRGR